MEIEERDYIDLMQTIVRQYRHNPNLKIKENISKIHDKYGDVINWEN
jgi:hypothetical protein